MSDPNESWMPGTPTGPNVSWMPKESTSHEHIPQTKATVPPEHTRGERMSTAAVEALKLELVAEKLILEGMASAVTEAAAAVRTWEAQQNLVWRYQRALSALGEKE